MVAAVALVSVAGCAAAPAPGARVALTGSLHVKGNEPFPMVVLQTDDHADWELMGTTVGQARGLTGQRVTIQGTVLRAPGANTWLPALRVDVLRIAPAP
nr:MULTISPECIES: hypothetical protein [unclassified Cupriavidus]